MWGGLASTDNSNMFFVCHCRVRVNNEQDHLNSNHTDRMPTLFPIFKTIGHNQMERIVKNLLREVKGDAMFGKVAPRFLGIPLEPHRAPLAYKYVRTNM